jgi:hypothetical protein
VQEYRRLYATLPLVRLAHPDFPARRVEVDSLRGLALPFRPPAADVRQARGVVELDGDSLWFRRVDVVLPASRATIGGKYTFASGALTLAGRADPLALADARVARPALPDGTVRAGFAVSLDSTRTAIRLNDLQAALAQAGRADATAQGAVGLVIGPGDTLRFDGTNVTFANVGTALVERLAPTVDVPRTGVLAGRVAADGTLERLALDGDVTFDDAQAGRSRVQASGELGAGGGEFRASGLRVTPRPDAGGARAHRRARPAGGRHAHRQRHGERQHEHRAAGERGGPHAPRPRRALARDRRRVGVARLGRGARRGADAVRALDANLRLDPLSLATVGASPRRRGCAARRPARCACAARSTRCSSTRSCGLAGGGRAGGAVTARGRVGSATCSRTTWRSARARSMSAR